MKIDFSTIVVILFTLLFIILGGISKRRKKSTARTTKVPYKQPFIPEKETGEFLKDAVTMINDPFAKLDKMFNISEQMYHQEGESLEAETGREPGSLEVTDIEPTSLEMTESGKSSLEEISGKESQSLEIIVDEVAEYMKEKDKQESGLRAVKPYDYGDLTGKLTRKAGISEEKIQVPLELFKDFDDFKKAIIYSEILNRKEF